MLKSVRQSDASTTNAALQAFDVTSLQPDRARQQRGCSRAGALVRTRSARAGRRHHGGRRAVRPVRSAAEGCDHERRRHADHPDAGPAGWYAAQPTRSCCPLVRSGR